MTFLNPTITYDAAYLAYDSEESSLNNLQDLIRSQQLQIKPETIKILRANTGWGTGTLSNFGFLAELSSGRDKQLIISTRGTASLADTATDLNFLTERGPTGHQVHGGFNRTFKSYIRDIKLLIDQQKLGYRPTAIHCIGHSLGGALANLNAAALSELGYNTYLYTLAAPRVGQIPYAEHLSRRFNSEHVFRVVNEADVVPMVPCFPFTHAPYEKGTYLLQGSISRLSAVQHMLGQGYASMKGKSWLQIRNEATSRALKREMLTAFSTGADGLLLALQTQLNQPRHLQSTATLQLISHFISAVMELIGKSALLTVRAFSTGAFTTLDQFAEILVRAVQFGEDKIKKIIAGIVHLTKEFLGMVTNFVEDVTISTIRHIFAMLEKELMRWVSRSIGATLQLR